MYKVYFNDELIEYFQKKVNKINVDKVFKPLLIDILLRRSYEFELSPQEIEQDIESLSHNLRKIQIGKMPKDIKTATGLYMGDSKKIILEEEMVRRCLYSGSSQGLDKIYAILTHEVYHTLSREKNGKDRLSTINSMTGKRSHALVEAVIETAADRAVYSRVFKDKMNFRKDTAGYPEMTFVVPVLAATYGVTEKEFLKHALMGRTDLITFLASKANEGTFRTAQFLDGIELNLDKIHKVLYPNRGKVSKDKRTEEISEGIFAISHMCNCKLEERYNCTPLKNYGEIYRFTENAKYNHLKLHYILETEMENLDRVYGLNIVPIITEMKRESEYDERTAISEMDKVVCCRQNFYSESEFAKVYEYARRGMLDNLDPIYLAEKGIGYGQRGLGVSYVDQNIKRNLDNQDFQIATPWDNYYVQDYIYREMSGIISRKDSIRNVINRIEDFFIIREDSPSAVQIRSGKIEEKPDYFKLSSDDLEKFNKGAKQVVSKKDTNKQVKEKNERDKETE